MCICDGTCLWWCYSTRLLSSRLKRDPDQLPKSKQILQCPSCGRRGDTGPNAAETVTGHGGEWCRNCAVLITTSDGSLDVDPTGPGAMSKSAVVDPIDAFRDCYKMEPKKRIRVSVAKVEVQRAWDLWDGDKDSSASKSIFYGWLQRHRPYFLTFRSSTDHELWQKVNGWLTQHEAHK